MRDATKAKLVWLLFLLEPFLSLFVLKLLEIFFGLKVPWDALLP